MKLLTCNDSKAQVEILPDTKFWDAIRILRKGTPISSEVQKIILSFGLDDQEQSYATNSKKQLHQLIHVAQITSSNAEIFIPVLNFSCNLPYRVRRTILTLKHLIQDTPRPISRIPQQFQTERDNIRWTPYTAECI